jgi:hypothetical protein
LASRAVTLRTWICKVTVLNLDTETDYPEDVHEFTRSLQKVLK